MFSDFSFNQFVNKSILPDLMYLSSFVISGELIGGQCQHW